jgi:hypothetical protein
MRSRIQASIADAGQHVRLGDNFTGAGNEPSRTRAQMLDFRKPTRASTCAMRRRDSGGVPGGVWFASMIDQDGLLRATWRIFPLRSLHFTRLVLLDLPHFPVACDQWMW